MAFLVRNREARVFMKRTELEGMREWEVIERYRLSSRRIQWLIHELYNPLDRERNCPLSPETQVSSLEIKTLIWSQPLSKWNRGKFDLFVTIFSGAYSFEILCLGQSGRRHNGSIESQCESVSTWCGRVLVSSSKRVDYVPYFLRRNNVSLNICFHSLISSQQNEKTVWKSVWTDKKKKRCLRSPGTAYAIRGTACRELWSLPVQISYVGYVLKC